MENAAGERIVLDDGAVGLVRRVAREDAARLEQLFDDSGGDARQRFFRERTDPAKGVGHLITLEPPRGVGLVVTVGDRLAGVAGYEMVGDVADVEFLVSPEFRGRGIGAHLLQRLTEVARGDGIATLRALVKPDNHAMLRLLRGSGHELRRMDTEPGSIEVELATERSAASDEAEWERERHAVAASLMPIFYPHSVAVVGASREPTSIGGRLFRNLLNGGFTGPVYPVNPKAEVVSSVKAFPSVSAIPDPVELAFIVVPAPHVLDVVADCRQKGVRGLVVISAGFAETGEEGAQLEARLLQTVRDAGMRMVGPNCMGVLNTDPAVLLDGQFGPVVPPAGNVAMSSQSGALGIAILDYARQLDIGISTFISVGNKADVSGNDLLLYWEQDPATDVILLYLESFGNPRLFARLARRIARTKPIVAVKSGRTGAGARAASSHTGSLASLDVAVDALFQQAGVIRTETLSELFDVTSLLANQPIPAGPRVAVLTNAGGPGILASDALESRELQVVELSEDLQQRLQAHLSPAASTRNPVDMIASAGPEQYAACLEELLGSDEVDAVIAIYIPASPEGSEEVAAAIASAAERNAGGKTLLAVYMSSSGAPAELAAGGVPVPTYRFPEPAAIALERAVRYADWRERPEGEVVTFADADPDAARAVVDEALTRLGPGGGWLEPGDVDSMLQAMGLRVAVATPASSAAEAVEIAAAIEGPVVLKVISPTATHKSDVGGIALDVEGEDEVRSAFDRVTSAVDDATGALVQEFVPEGHEVILGMTEDPSFGPLLVFGLGGVFVELIGDVAFRIHPITDRDASEMIAEVSAARLLEGYRGSEPGDVPALEEALLRLSQLIEAIPEIEEMDLNPVKVLPPGEGVVVVDARIRVEARPEHWVPNHSGGVLS